MTTKYATYNIKDGTYIFHESVEDAINYYIGMVIDTIKDPNYNTIYSTVTTQEDGSETWKNEVGEITKFISVKQISRSLQSKLDSKFITKVEVL